MSNLSRTPGSMPDRPSMKPAESLIGRGSYESSAQRRASLSNSLVKEKAKELGIDTRGKRVSDIRREVQAVQKMQNGLANFAMTALNKKVANAGGSDQQRQSPTVQSSGSHSDPASPFLHDSASAPQAAAAPAKPAKAAPRPFELVAATSGDPAVASIRVLPSTLAGALPDGMDNPAVDFLLTPAGGTQLVYGLIILNGITGLVTSREILQGSSVPEDGQTIYHVPIGSYVFADGAITSVSNYRYGPIDATICRNWFTAEAPFYGVTFAGFNPNFL